MAGAKPTNEEKAQIKDLAQRGYKVEEIQARFPHIDGRSIAGIHVRATAKNPSPETQAQTIPPNPVAETQGVSTESTVNSSGNTSRAVTVNLDANKTPQQIAAETLGFTPVVGTIHNPGGFTPMYREYFIVKKVDPPNEGVQKTEYPPFGITELYNRYPTGEYEIHHYREGRLFATYRDKIVKPDSNSSTNQNNPIREAPVQRDPADLILKGVDLFDRLNAKTKEQVVQADLAKAQAEAAKEQAKARVEEAATVGLIKILEKQAEPKPDIHAPVMDKILAIMQQERLNAETRHMQEMAALEKKHAAELEREKLRLQAESERLKSDIAFREKMQQEFLAKMAEIERARNELAREAQEKLIENIRDVQEAYKADLEEKKRFMEKHLELQMKYTDEIIRIKREAGTGYDSLRMAEIVKDGIVGGLDRVGARIDMLVEKGVIPGPSSTSTGIQRSKSALGIDQNNDRGSNEPMTKDAIKDVLKEPWFKDLQDEIAVTIQRRKMATNPALKPHGSLLGQAFIDRLNKDPRIRPFMTYLITRYWNEKPAGWTQPSILEDAAEGIKSEYMELFKEPEAELWFREFQEFLTMAWNASIGIRN
jgi:hypothetical protein